MSLRIAVPVAIVLSLVLCPGSVFAQSEEKIPLLKVKLKVVDPEGHALEGARVQPSGLRAKGGSHYFWNPKTHGEPKTFVTDANGVVEVEYPKFVYEKLVTGEVTWMVQHDDYVKFREDRTVEDPEVIQLEDGYQIAVTAADEAGKRIANDLHAVIAGGWGMNWKVRQGGVLTSPVLSRQQALLRLVQLPENGPPLFSELQTVLPEPEKKRVFLRDLKLRKGTRFVGKLDESVTRPIGKGHVVARIVTPGLPDPKLGRQPGWSWSDSTDINADGTFEFSSLPSGEVVQLIAVCDGWISAQPEGDLKAKYPDLVRRNPVSGSMRYPQLFELAGTSVEFTLKMEKAVACRVTIQDPDGKPLPDAMVHMWPNQFFFSLGSQVLGNRLDSVKMLRIIRSGEPLNTAWNLDSAYSVKTNSSGVAVVKNLPGSGSFGVAAEHSKYEQAAVGDSRETTVVLTPDEDAQVTIKLQPKGTQTIGSGD
jgi:hypothetical protein